VGLRRCPHLLNLTTKLGKTQQKRKKQARSTHVLVYPRLEEEGRPCHYEVKSLSKIKKRNFYWRDKKEGITLLESAPLGQKFNPNSSMGEVE
jgi:hypothetical protein